MLGVIVCGFYNEGHLTDEDSKSNKESKTNQVTEELNKHYNDQKKSPLQVVASSLYTNKGYFFLVTVLVFP